MQSNINVEDDNQIATLSLKELAEILVKYYKLHDGLYETSIGFQIALGGVGPTPDTVVPGAMLGVANFGLRKTHISGMHTVDASLVNPKVNSKKSNKIPA